MTYTEITERGNKKYYYRVKSIRKGKDVEKKRIYLGKNMNKKQLRKAEQQADKQLIFLKNVLNEKELKDLEKIKKEYLKEQKESYENKYEAFCSLFTYNSTAIEGNTLTLQETAHLLFNNIPPSKSMREINETLNHKEAFDFLLQHKADIDKKLILNLHKLIVKNTLKPELESQIGKYRNIQVYIRGSTIIPSKPKDVPKEMTSLLFWYSRNKSTIHPLILAAYLHGVFEMSHPFVDGNGRVGRLLMNFIMHKHNYPMINITNAKKLQYYEALQKMQEKGDVRALTLFLMEMMKEGKIRF